MIIDRERFKLVKRRDKLINSLDELWEEHRELRKKLNKSESKRLKVFQKIQEINEKLNVGETNG
jgi:uncharacterized coiled-coil DUF342 family protein